MIFIKYKFFVLLYLLKVIKSIRKIMMSLEINAF